MDSLISRERVLDARVSETGGAAKFKFPVAESITCSEARPPPPLSALQLPEIRLKFSRMGRRPKEMPFSRISRSLSGGTTAYVGPGATRATVHGRERSQCSL